MTLKTKLITTISMFFLVVALLITGVWAVSSANVNIGGTISFNATNIYATITGSITGATTTPTLSPLNYSANSTPTTTELNSWKQNLTFADATTPTIKWTVTIQNKSERALYVTLTDNISTLTNATKTLTFDGSSASGEKTIPAKTSKTYTMEIKVTDTNASASVEYDFNFDLRDASASQNQGGGDDTPVDVEKVSYLTFTYNDTTMEATLTGWDGTTADVVIPAKIINDGKTYTVTSMAQSYYDGDDYIGTFIAKAALKSISIPSTITNLSSSAFLNCTGLTSVTIGAGITSIGQSTFKGCEKLSIVNILATTPPTGFFMFDDCSDDLVIYVPSASVDEYKAASGWSTYATKIQGKNF